MTHQDTKAIVKVFEEVCVDFATYKRKVTYEEYEAARDNVVNELSIRPVLPEWIISNRYGKQFWQFIKETSSDYAGRRQYLWSSFDEIYNFIENGANGPVALSIREVTTALQNKDVEALWRKVHARRNDDPEGSITAARTMLEATLKYILDCLEIPYTTHDDLPGLYNKVADVLTLSPAAHHEALFKQILQGIKSTVHGFGEMRNKYGDAHVSKVKPEARHADLAINLSGTMCTFLLDTYSANKESKIAKQDV